MHKKFKNVKPNQTWQAKIILYVLQVSSYDERRTDMWHKQIKAIVISATL